MRPPSLAGRFIPGPQAARHRLAVGSRAAAQLERTQVVSCQFLLQHCRQPAPPATIQAALADFVQPRPLPTRSTEAAETSSVESQRKGDRDPDLATCPA